MNKGLAEPNVKDGKCPHCDIYREWRWDYFAVDIGQPLGCVTYCNQCKNRTIYYNGELIYPKNTLLMKPNILFDKYKKSKKLFLEAVEVSPISPRAGLTLARMCLESLTNEILQEYNEKIDEQHFNKNIEKLYELDIISAKLKTLLSSARIIGNKSTHNFNIIDTDNEPNLEDAEKVLKVINYILENIRIATENEKDLLELEKRIKEKNVKQTNDN